MMTSFDIHGPVVRPRTEKLWTWVDPLGFRDNFRYEFEMDIMDSLETESTAMVMVTGKVLKTGSTYNDYYGFGTSRNEAINDAKTFAEELAGANVDIIVKTTLTTQAVFFDEKKKPFYNGSIRCFHVPGSWRPQEGENLLSKKEVFETWRNGAAGSDAAALDVRIAKAKAEDAAGDRRNGDLR